MLGLTPADMAVVEGHKEGLRVETPKGPLGQVALEGDGHGGSLRVLEGHQVVCISTRRKPPEEDRDGDGSGDGGEKDGPGLPQV